MGRIERILERVDPIAAARVRDARSDAGSYLLARATWEGRVGDLLEHAADVQAAIERSGAWEEGHEWRIGTASTNRIELKGRRYRVSTACDGIYSATVRSLPTAIEALHVLFALQVDLFYEVGWASQPRSSVRHGTREPYLARISKEAVRGEVERNGASTIRPTSVDWLEGTGYEVVVERRCLSMTCVSPTMARATQFAGIFEAVEADIARLLAWH